MNAARHYTCLPHPENRLGAHRITAVQPEQIEAIRRWRNAQIALLRQSEPLSPEQQQRYYAEQIWPTLPLPEPPQILLCLFFQPPAAMPEQLVGYGGLVHIVWPHRRAEVSLLLDDQLANDPRAQTLHLSAYLLLVQQLAFRDLAFNKLTTETYATRASLIPLLEAAGFRQEGLLCEQVIKQGQPCDAWLHARLRADWMREEAGHSAVNGAQKAGEKRLEPPPAAAIAPLTLRRATAEDAALLYVGRNAEAVRRASRENGLIAWEEHRHWLQAVLHNPRQLLLIAQREPTQLACGVIRYDLLDSAHPDSTSPPPGVTGPTAEVSLYLLPGHAGHGLGSALLAAGEQALRQQWPDVQAILAHILADNPRSLHLFTQAGYRLHRASPTAAEADAGTQDGNYWLRLPTVPHTA